MSDPTKGGRGKKAPYQTIHYRIPEPIKPVVEQLATAYKRLVANGVEVEDLLNGVWTAISQGHWKASGSPASAEHKQLEDRITELDNTNWELEKRYSQLNELWMQSERKRGELQAELDKSTTESKSSSRTADEIAKLKAEFEQGLTELQTQLKERNQQLADTITQKQKLEGKAKAAEALTIQQSKEISRLDTKLAEALTRKSKPIDPATLFNQLRPLLNRLSDRDRRAIQQKLEEIVDN